MSTQTQTQTETQLSLSTSTKHVKLTEIELPTKWKAPQKPPFRKNILDDPDVKETLLKHDRQSSLDRNQIQMIKNTPKKQICIEMLKEGYHKSFRELDLIFRLQIDERNRLGSEHPVWDGPLLDQEIEKLEYLCKKLNLAEAAERTENNKSLYKHYNDIANYFLVHDEGWLSDYFLDKCLKIAETKLDKSEPSCLAEAHANLGLAFERLTNDYTAKSDRIRESYFQAKQHLEAYYELSKGQDWTVQTSFDDLSKSNRTKLINIRNEKVEANLKSLVENGTTMFMDACIHLQRLYRIISNRYAKNSQERVEYLKKAFDVCKESSIGSLEGHSSSLLGTIYEENGDYKTALSYFVNYYEISRKEKDIVNYGESSQALAKIYEKLGQINKSIEILEKCLQEISNKDANEQYSRACDCLSVIYNSLGKYETASEYSRKSFEASRQLHGHGNAKHLDYNRVLFGISSAHKNLRLFEKNIDLATRKTLNNLIWWKYDSRKERLLSELGSGGSYGAEEGEEETISEDDLSSYY